MVKCLALPRATLTYEPMWHYFSSQVQFLFRHKEKRELVPMERTDSLQLNQANTLFSSEGS